MAEELNKKLAEFAGFSPKEFCEVGGQAYYWYVSPDGEEANVNFTESLDACFKWLVPLAIKKFGKHKVRMMLVHWVTAVMLGEEPALALCKAIEKLIDEEK